MSEAVETTDPAKPLYVWSSTRAAFDYVGENPENCYGHVLAIYPGKALTVICGHGGSMWLCRACAEMMVPIGGGAR